MTETRLTEKEARKTPFRMTRQDSDILLALHAVRFAHIQQMARQLGLSRQGTDRRLKRLCRHLYVDRQLWGRQHIYMLGTLGIEYVAHAVGIAESELRKRQARQVSPFFLDHYLAIADVYVALSAASKSVGLTMTWRNEVEAADSYQLPSGRRRKLEPDGVFTLRGAGVATTRGFLEVDRATESLRQWNSKVRDYNDYFLSGRIVEKWKLPERVVVLVTAPDLRRTETLRKFTQGRWKASLGNGRIPVGFTVQEAVQSERILELPWAGLSEGASIRLIEAEGS